MTIYVRILNGVGLKGSNVVSNKINPYILVSHGMETQKTQKFESNENPDWNESFKFKCVKENPLVFKLWDDNTPLRSDLIGEASIIVTNFFNVTKRTWIPFTKTNGDMAGDIHVEISFLNDSAAPPDTSLSLSNCLPLVPPGQSSLSGKLAFPTAWDHYEGSVGGGIPHGKGVCVFGNGDRYEGEWVGGSRMGKGLFTWPNGDRYEGDFVLNMMEGHGVFTEASGKRWEGQWRQNKRLEEE